VQQVGFISKGEYLGFSPDGLVGDAGGVEIKCPEQHTHLRYMRSGGNAWKAYRWQVIGALWLTGREWWDFVSYCPKFAGVDRLYVERVYPDPDMFAKLDAGSEACIAKIKEIEAGNA
jgi:hypothetical protein